MTTRPPSLTKMKKRKIYRTGLLKLYERLFYKKENSRKIKRSEMINVKLTTFFKKITLFKFYGFVIKKHKNNLLGSLTVSSYVSKNRFYMTIPYGYPPIEFY